MVLASGNRQTKRAMSSIGRVLQGSPTDPQRLTGQLGGRQTGHDLVGNEEEQSARLPLKTSKRPDTAGDGGHILAQRLQHGDGDGDRCLLIVKGQNAFGAAGQGLRGVVSSPELSFPFGETPCMVDVVF
jgi:hypothetical protein